MSTLKQAHQQIRSLASPSKVKILQRFFKTGPGEYGAGDIFLGITVPQSRKVAKTFEDLSLQDTLTLLKSAYHEERLVALLILIAQYNKSDDAGKGRIYRAYLKSVRWINNWDLVDLTAHHIVGHYLWNKDKSILKELAKSTNLWKKRIAIVATYDFIKRNRFHQTLSVAKILLRDEHDLIHKAVGWMLREVGKKDMQTEEGFLKKHYRVMPRTMLRYAIERFPEPRRQAYLKGTV